MFNGHEIKVQPAMVFLFTAAESAEEATEQAKKLVQSGVLHGFDSYILVFSLYGNRVYTIKLFCERKMEFFLCTLIKFLLSQGH